MSPSRRTRDTKLVKGEWVSDNYWRGEPIEETRQQYANHYIREYQREFSGNIEWPDLLWAFRKYGTLYDRGFRFREGLEGAA